MLGDAFAIAWLLGEYSRGARVALDSLAERELGVGAAAKDGVDEGERLPGVDDPRRLEQAGRVGSLGHLETGEPCRLEQIALLEDRKGAGEPTGVRR